MKNYLVFAGDHYYPSGGAMDYQGDFATVDEARAWFKERLHEFDWMHIVDRETMEFVSEEF